MHPTWWRWPRKLCQGVRPGLSPGRPPKHDKELRFAKPETWGEPDTAKTQVTDRYGTARAMDLANHRRHTQIRLLRAAVRPHPGLPGPCTETLSAGAREATWLK